MEFFDWIDETVVYAAVLVICFLIIDNLKKW